MGRNKGRPKIGRLIPETTLLKPVFKRLAAPVFVEPPICY